jgi:hypothetical protein
MRMLYKRYDAYFKERSGVNVQGSNHYDFILQQINSESNEQTKHVLSLQNVRSNVS